MFILFYFSFVDIGVICVNICSAPPTLYQMVIGAEFPAQLAITHRDPEA